MAGDHDVDAVVRLGKVALEFARIERATAMEDGVTPESDTDHTVMLGLIACAYASAHDKTLSVGRVAQFALVHDLVEVYAGDTNTYGLTAHTLKESKEAREAHALARIKEEFDSTVPWLSRTIEEYESLDSKEARFIRTLDKALPKVTNILNEGKRLRSHGGEGEFAEFCEKQQATLLATYGHDQPYVLELYQKLVERVLKIL